MAKRRQNLFTRAADAFLPLAGQAFGGAFGGPAGAYAGSQAGQAGANIISGRKTLQSTDLDAQNQQSPLKQGIIGNIFSSGKRRRPAPRIGMAYPYGF